MLKNVTFLLTLLLFGACSSIMHKQDTELSSNKLYAIAAFSNYSQTPMAGMSAATIVESVLAEENIAIHSLIKQVEKSEKKSEKKLLNLHKEKAKALGINYLIVGDVQEWRYKTGIDGEPVVSYSIKVIDLKNNTILFNGVGAKSSWGHKSIGVIAQEIARDLIPKFIN